MVRTDSLLLLGHVAVQALQPVKLLLVGLGVVGEAADGLEEAAARVVLVPPAVLPAHPPEQPLLLPELALRLFRARRRLISRLLHRHDDLMDLEQSGASRQVGVAVFGRPERMIRPALDAAGVDVDRLALLLLLVLRGRAEGLFAEPAAAEPEEGTCPGCSPHYAGWMIGSFRRRRCRWVVVMR